MFSWTCFPCLVVIAGLNAFGFWGLLFQWPRLVHRRYSEGAVSGLGLGVASVFMWARFATFPSTRVSSCFCLLGPLDASCLFLVASLGCIHLCADTVLLFSHLPFCRHCIVQYSPLWISVRTARFNCDRDSFLWVCSVFWI